ncbi:MAG: pyridoxine 5'-phosphate oxidase C-terminal domain-containing protein [Candidatus Rokuibacteriota bacterium]
MPNPDPVAELVADRERARAAGDPFADLCVLATVDAAGAPGVRTLVLRDVGPQGVGLLVSALSPKWAPLEAGRYECLLAWLRIRRQYRLRGRLVPMPEERLAGYWRDKIYESRLLDLYYGRVQAQSTPVGSRERFLDGIDALRRAHPTADDVPRPDSLRGVYLLPDRVEVWRGAPDRLHDRRLFQRTDTGWREDVLVP